MKKKAEPVANANIGAASRRGSLDLDHANE
jgi:hypothetical protein